MWLYRFYGIVGFSGWAYGFWSCFSNAQKLFDKSDKLTEDLQRQLKINKT